VLPRCYSAAVYFVYFEKWRGTRESQPYAHS
jgi:hypothetical protein